MDYSDHVVPRSGSLPGSGVIVRPDITSMGVKYIISKLLLNMLGRTPICLEVYKVIEPIPQHVETKS